MASWAIEDRQDDGVHNVNLTAIKLGALAMSDSSS
jgi:hypothetical protein